ncbi:MAG: hypothetical protein HY900_18570 [Deltaproteobacteria bacterium]|nr:hypothetical protein [Deltaproteobacteria bacterium]
MRRLLCCFAAITMLGLATSTASAGDYEDEGFVADEAGLARSMIKIGETSEVPRLDKIAAKALACEYAAIVNPDCPRAKAKHVLFSELGRANDARRGW